MPDDRLADVREDARRAVDAYGALDRNERMDRNVLSRHAIRFHNVLDSLVDAVQSRDDVEDIRRDARDALQEFDDPTAYDDAQHVRRACYVLRQKTTSLLTALDND